MSGGFTSPYVWWAYPLVSDLPAIRFTLHEIRVMSDERQFGFLPAQSPKFSCFRKEKAYNYGFDRLFFIIELRFKGDRIMKWFKVYRCFLAVVICLSLLAIGCRPSTKETKVQAGTEPPKLAEPAVQPEKQAPEPEPQPESQVPPVELTLKFTPQDSATYGVVTESRRTIKGEGSLATDSAFKGGTTANKAEMTFTQQIKSVDDKGNAVVEITISGLKYTAKMKDNVTMDFDSSREKDWNNPLYKLVGQSYAIELTPSGQVSKVIDAARAQALITGDSPAGRTALQVLSTNAIEQRHSIPALPAADQNQRRPGDNWSSVKGFSFGMMGSKSYERIYTLKQIEDVDDGRIAVIEMDAIPSAELTEELQDEQTMGIFSKMFDNTETYTGRLKLDLTTGQVEEYFEKLVSEWVAVDPAAGQSGESEPAALRMTATRFHHIEKLD